MLRRAHAVLCCAVPHAETAIKMMYWSYLCYDIDEAKVAAPAALLMLSSGSFLLS